MVCLSEAKFREADLSIPFFDEEFTFTQPDGTRLRVRGTGDENSAVFETLDGFTAVENPSNGFYEYAVLGDEGQLSPMGVTVGAVNPKVLGLNKSLRPSADLLRARVYSTSGLSRSPNRWEVRRGERRAAIRTSIAAPDILPAPPQRRTVGNFVGLCLMVQFPDVSGTASVKEVEDFCNRNGYKGFGNNGSVADYFRDISNGKLNFTHVVAPYYTAKNPRAYYTNDSIPYGVRAQELIREALSYHIANQLDFSKLSSDDADYVYAVSVFYAGTRVNNWAKGLWPHAHHLNTPVKLASGKLAHDYQITDMTDELKLGTFCHENGHMLCDFPDLYDKKGPASYGVGVYCLMCSGGNADPKNPTRVCGYLRYAAGWIDSAHDMKPDSKLALRSGQNDFAVFRKNAQEYFLVENRSRAGRDAALPDEGLAIWHVDELGDNSDEQMSPSNHFECSLIQADGKNELEKNVNQGNDKDLFHAPYKDSFSDNTSPSSHWWDGTASKLSIRKVSAPGTTMTLEIGPIPKPVSKLPTS